MWGLDTITGSNFIKGSFGTHHFISFGINEMKWYDEIISFGKATEMTGYHIGIKIRHGIKIMEFEMNSVTNFVTAKQVISRITNEFLDSSPKRWKPNKSFSLFIFWWMSYPKKFKVWLKIISPYTDTGFEPKKKGKPQDETNKSSHLSASQTSEIELRTFFNR
jgi:hypothetical protein